MPPTDPPAPTPGGCPGRICGDLECLLPGGHHGPCERRPAIRWMPGGTYMHGWDCAECELEYRRRPWMWDTTGDWWSRRQEEEAARRTLPP